MEQKKPEVKVEEKKEVKKEALLSAEEKQTLIQLLDLAVKAGGLQASQGALYFVNKFGLGQKDGK